MKTVKLSLSLLLVFSSPMAFSNDNSALTGAAIQSIKQNQAQVSNTANTSSGSNAVRDTQTSNTTKTPTQNTINQAADTGRSSQNSGAMMNMMASAALFASCFASCPKCRMELCAMGAMAAAQGAHQAGAAKASDMTYDLSEFNPNTPGGTPASVDPGGDAGFTDPKIKEGMDKLTESGYTVTPDGVTFPDGSFQPASAFNSGSSMVAAGMDPAAARAADDVMAAINGELSSGASVASMGLESGGGGYSGGAGGGADFGELESFSMAGMKNPFSKVDEKKLLAGKSMMVGGEPIGVKGDNIFDMVHRAYQKKRGKNQFLETQKGSLRLPTSLTKE